MCTVIYKHTPAYSFYFHFWGAGVPGGGREGGVLLYVWQKGVSGPAADKHIAHNPHNTTRAFVSSTNTVYINLRKHARVQRTRDDMTASGRGHVAAAVSACLSSLYLRPLSPCRLNINERSISHQKHFPMTRSRIAAQQQQHNHTQHIHTQGNTCVANIQVDE